MADSSSDDDIEHFTLDEGIESWLYNKTLTTRDSYLRRISQFRSWMQSKYNREIDRCKSKHIRMYLNFKAKSCKQIRAIVVVIKSLFKHLVKCNVVDKNPAASFDSGKQKPAKHERNLSSDTVRALFRLAQKKKNPSTLILLQIAVYCGM